MMNSEEMRSKWELYAKAWSPVTDAEREQILQGSLSPDFWYIDPRIECPGRKEITDNLEGFQQRQPGGSFILRSILSHRDVALVNWQLIKKDGTAANQGFDVVRFTESGLLANITAFFVAYPTP